jgi:predicted Zn-dependent peptidase
MTALGRVTGLAAALSLVLAFGAASDTGGITRTQLPNGLVVLVRENPTAPVVAVSLMVKMGTRWETRDTAGISNFLQLMVVRGTATRSGSQIVAIADGLGGSIDAYGDADFSEIAGTALARHWIPLLELVADVALNPTVPESLVGPVRDFLVRQVRNRGERPFTAGLDTLTAQLFGANPYAWDPRGLPESLARLDRNALMALYRRHYVPGGLVLAVSGQVKAAEVIAQAERLFGQMPPGSPPVPQPPNPPPPAPSRDVLIVPGAQAQILIGTLAPALSDPDYPAVKVLSTVLGGGMAGRFFAELRDQQGLAYTTATDYPTRIDTSYFLAMLGTAPANAVRAEAALAEQLDRVQRQPVSAEELRVAKAFLLGRLAMDRRTNARQAWYLAAYELAGVGPDFLDGFTARVRAVSAADVQRVAQRYLAVRRAVVVEPAK